MADEFPERTDPVLVRPYITTEPGGAASGDRPAETWPESAMLPEDGTREIPPVVVEAPGPGPVSRSSALLRQRLLVLAGVGVLALLGVGGFVVFGPSEDAAPPPAARPAPAAPGATGASGAAPAASPGVRSVPASSRATRSPAAAGNATSPSAAPPKPSGQATNNTPPASATLAPPPGTARTGPVTAAGGRCLNLGGLFGIDGSPVQTTACTGVSYQQWTLGTDGTLAVAGKCAEATGDGTVRIAACDDRPSAQWRAGPDGSLVNPQTGRCLTDPGSAGATTKVTECTGAADQHWKLP